METVTDLSELHISLSLYGRQFLIISVSLKLKKAIY